MKELSITIKNELRELEKVNQALAQFSELHQLPADVSNAISLALDEIITNIVEYGYQDQEEHLIDVRISLEEGQLTLVIEDDGVPFDPLDTENPDTTSSLEERPIGGLGIHLVRNVMDEVTYNYRNDKNYLVLTKKMKTEEP